jgi:ribosome-associated translation inhibitor RaiA
MGDPARSSTPAPVIDVQVQARGRVTRGAKRSAAEKIRSLSHLISVPVLSARVRLTQSADPAVERPATAQASLDLNGRLLRAHVAAPTMREAIDELNDRLRARLERQAPDWQSMRGTTAAAASVKRRRTEIAWRDQGSGTDRGMRRRIIQRTSYSLPRITPHDAALDLDMLDEDFHLFTDLHTGQDSVLSRETGGTLRLAQLHPRPEERASSDLQLCYSPLPAPRLSVPAAAEQLDLGGSPFVFFENSQTGRGNVLYHRRDGHHGLIIPVD